MTDLSVWHTYGVTRVLSILSSAGGPRGLRPDPDSELRSCLGNTAVYAVAAG